MKKISRASGFSLVEVVMVAALISGLSLVMLNISKQSNKASVKLQFDTDVTLATNEINGILSDPAKCLATFGSTATPSNINGKYYLSTVPPGNIGYGNSGLKLTSYSLSGTAPNGVLTILYENKNILKGSSGPANISKKINLYIEKPSSAITKCRALSTSVTDIWTRGTAATDTNNIFYSGGVRAGDETQTTTCNATTEGTQRYNKAAHTMEYCGWSAGPIYAWTAMSGGGGGILAKGRVYLGSSTKSRTENITITSSGVLIFTAWATMRTSSGPNSAGVRAILMVDGTTCSQDYSFEAQANGLDFDVAPICIVSLTAGSHTIRFTGDYRLETTYSSSMSWVVHKE
jgi:type II secretory pathway pseudopilin PulG